MADCRQKDGPPGLIAEYAEGSKPEKGKTLADARENGSCCSRRYISRISEDKTESGRVYRTRARMRRLQGIVLIVVSATCFGAMPIFARVAYDSGANAVSVLFLRFAIAAICMVAVMRVRRITFPKGQTLVILVVMGAIGNVGQTLAYFTALTLASASLVALLLYLYPALVALLSWVFFGKPITKARLAALVSTLVGTVLTIGLGGGGRPLGIILAIIAAVIYAGYIVLGSKVLQTTGAFSSSATIVLSTTLVYGGLIGIQGIALPHAISGWASIVALALISTVLALGAFFAGLKAIDPATASMLSTLDPVVTVVLAALILGETVHLHRIIGGTLILLSVILLTRSEVADEVIQGSAVSGSPLT